MKSYILKLLFLLIAADFYPQEIIEPEGWALAEIFMITKGLPPEGTDSIRYKLEAISDVWQADHTIPYSNYQKTSDYDIAYYPKMKYKGVRNTPDYYFNTRNILGFNFLFESENEAEPLDMDSYGWGKYKLTALYISPNGSVTERASFIIDFRDCRYPNYPYPVNGHSTDIWIKYDNSGTGLFSIRSQGPSSPDDYWQPVLVDQTIYIWQLKEQSDFGSPSVDNFPAYLVVCPKSGLDNIPVPYLTWGSFPDFNATGYEIYWSIGSPNNLNLLTTISPVINEYYHEGVALNGTKIAHYKVKVLNSNHPAEFTNMEELKVSGYFFKSSANENRVIKFELFQNIPNPFNLRTLISFAIPKSNFIQLKVYDLLGCEIATLVDGFKNEGSFSIHFDARNFHAGVYFYTLRAGDFVQTKKMCLLK